MFSHFKLKYPHNFSPFENFNAFFSLSLSQKKIDYISFEALCCVSVRSVRVRIVSIFHFFFALFSLSLLLFHLAVVYACVSVCSTWNSRLLIEVSLREFRALLIVFILCCLVCGWLFFSLHSALFLLLRCVWHSICTIYFSRSIVFVFLSLSSQYMATINDENAFLVFPSIACSVLANKFFFRFVWGSLRKCPRKKSNQKIAAHIVTKQIMCTRHAKISELIRHESSSIWLRLFWKWDILCALSVYVQCKTAALLHTNSLFDKIHMVHACRGEKRHLCLLCYLVAIRLLLFVVFALSSFSDGRYDVSPMCALLLSSFMLHITVQRLHSIATTHTK